MGAASAGSAAAGAAEGVLLLGAGLLCCDGGGLADCDFGVLLASVVCGKDAQQPIVCRTTRQQLLSFVKGWI